MAKKGFGPIDEEEFQYVDYNYREDTEKKARGLKEFKDIKKYELLNNLEIIYLKKYLMHLKYFN